MQPTIEEPATWSSTVLISDPSQSSQLVRGFYELQANTWRWAAPKFTVGLLLPRDAAKNGAWLVLKCSLPQASIDALKTVTVKARIGDTALSPETLTTPGDHTYRREVPASALTRSPIPVEFIVDKFLTPPNDGRPLALIVVSVGLEAK